MPPIALKEEHEHLLPIHEKEPHIEVYEIVEEEHQRPKRPLWRRFIRGFLTVSLVYFLTITFVPMIMRPFMGCRMHHHGLEHHTFDPSLPIDTLSSDKPKTHYEFKKDIDHFFIKQESQKKLPGPRTDVRGKVVLIHTKDDHTSVDFKIDVSDTRLWEYIKIQPQNNGLVFSADPWSLVDQHVNLTAHVKVPRDARWKGVYAGTRELDIKVEERLGDAIDKFGLESVSGHIQTPKDEADTTHAGWTKVRTVSGDIYGSYTVIKGIDVASASGNVNVKLHTATAEEDKIYLDSKTVSGKQNIHVVHPLQGRHLHSRMNSVSGDITARFPEEWQGTMKLTTTSGLFTVDGKNVKIVKKRKTIKGLFWKFIKGDKNLGTGKIGSVSGDIKASVGDL